MKENRKEIRKKCERKESEGIKNKKWKTKGGEKTKQYGEKGKYGEKKKYGEREKNGEWEK